MLDPWRALRADTALFKDPQLASCVASGTTEKQGHSHAWQTAKDGGPRTPSRTADANLDCVFFENALISLFQKMPPFPFMSSLQPTLSKPTEKEPFSSSGKRVVTSPLSLARCYWFIYGALVRQSGGYEPKTGRSTIRLRDYPTAVNNIKNVLPCVSDRVFMKRQAFLRPFMLSWRFFMTSVTFPMPFLVYNLKISLISWQIKTTMMVAIQ